ncbi:hypothetical protein CEXT_694771 [Caerostris extrusa]|uniref:Ribosomal protein L2 n=1 Tax=Caerostris extrusa TaxID=172846 RepID=A0AAV4QFS7_CAEEX|nr:hypothetical protein CEXT_694771 [Caerostris extrusa]
MGLFITKTESFRAGNYLSKHSIRNPRIKRGALRNSSRPPSPFKTVRSNYNKRKNFHIPLCMAHSAAQQAPQRSVPPRSIEDHQVGVRGKTGQTSSLLAVLHCNRKGLLCCTFAPASISILLLVPPFLRSSFLLLFSTPAIKANRQRTPSSGIETEGG